MTQKYRDVTKGFIITLKRGTRYYIRQDYVAWPDKNGKPTSDAGVSTKGHLEDILKQAGEVCILAYQRGSGMVGDVCRTFAKEDIQSIAPAQYPTTRSVLRLGLADRLSKCLRAYVPQKAA